jgi:hypothetical protein
MLLGPKKTIQIPDGFSQPFEIEYQSERRLRVDEERYVSGVSLGKEEYQSIVSLTA